MLYGNNIPISGFLFLVKKTYEAERLSLIKFVKHKSFKHWNAKDIYVFLMSNKDPIFILNTAIFIQKCLFGGVFLLKCQYSFL
jgi:hypothetical protein